MDANLNTNVIIKGWRQFEDNSEVIQYDINSLPPHLPKGIKNIKESGNVLQCILIPSEASIRISLSFHIYLYVGALVRLRIHCKLFTYQVRWFTIRLNVKFTVLI
jgi:hypothetical protein